MPRALTFEYVLTPAGLQRSCRVSCDDAGRILAVEPGVRDRPERGLALPGMPNAHSHVFQRAIVGRGEGSSQDSFWSWRAVMYRVANAIDAEDLHAIALRGFADMLCAGYTSVGEFHYVHHRRDGARGAEMVLAVRAAARATGIRLVLLPVLYQLGGFGLGGSGRDPAPDQMRFVHRSLDEFGRLLEALRDEPCGIAPHSLRAVALRTLPDVVALADSVLGREAPIHIHVSEQQREVDECRATHGRPPIECLADTIELGPRWSLVHATHAVSAELDVMARRDPNLVLCPLTEAYLGDGLFPLEALARARNADAPFAVGSDSNVRIDAIEELRLAEYGQRLQHQRRTALRGAQDIGVTLWNRTAERGARSLAQPVGVLEPGRFADITVLDLDDPLFEGLPAQNVLDAWLTAGSAAQIATVYVGGERRVERGEVVAVPGLERFAGVMQRIHEKR